MPSTKPRVLLNQRKAKMGIQSSRRACVAWRPTPQQISDMAEAKALGCSSYYFGQALVVCGATKENTLAAFKEKIDLKDYCEALWYSTHEKIMEAHEAHIRLSVYIDCRLSKVTHEEIMAARATGCHLNIYADHRYKKESHERALELAMPS